MKRRPSTFGVALVLAIATGAAPAQDNLKPFRSDDGKPVMRALPVRPPRALPADAVDDTADAPTAPTAPTAPAATPVPVPKAIPVRRAKPVKAAPEPQPARPAPPPAAPEPADPGEIRISPQAAARSPDQVQMEVADSYYSRKMYDMAAPEYQRYVEQYPGLPDMQAAFFRLGQCYQKMGSTNAAKSAYEQLLDRFQVGEFIGPAAYFLAQMNYDEKNYAAALPLFRKASVRLKEPGVVSAAKFFTARCLESQGPLYKLEARAIYEELSEVKENNLFRDASRLSYALILHEGKNTAEALKQIQILQKQTENPDILAEAAVHVGIWELELGQTEKAGADLKKSLELPEIGRWREVAELGLVRTYYDTGKYKQVLDAYADLTKGQNPSVQFSPETKPELLLLVSDALRQLGKYPEAIAQYDEIVKTYPNTLYAREASYQRLACFYNSNDPKLVAEIDAYLNNNPEADKRDQVMLMKAETFYKKQDYQAAAPLYEQISKSTRLTGTLKAESLFRYGWISMQLRDFDHAIKAFSSFIDDYPTNKSLPDAVTQRAVAFQSMKNLAAAEKDFDTVIRRFPKAAKQRELALQQKALIRGQQNDNAGMNEAFEQLLKDYPESAAAAQAHFWLGCSAFDAKDYPKAAAQLDKARELDKEQFFEKATLRIMLSYYYQDDKAGVAKEVDRYAKSGKSRVPVEVLRWLAEQLYNGASYENAEKYLSQLASRDDAQPKDILTLGKTCLDLKKYKQAGEALQRYLSMVHEPPSRALGLLDLSNAQIGQKDLAAAQKSVDEALTLQPEGKISGEARIVAGEIQEERGNFEDAAKLYMSVSVILDDEDVTPRALERAVKAYQKAGKDPEAKKTLNTLQSRYPEYFQKRSQEIGASGS